MKHIYNLISAANILRPTAKALGTALSGKILTLLYLSFLLLVSGESVGQTTEVIDNFDDTEITSTFERSLTGITIGSHRVSGGELTVQSAGIWLGTEQRYDGYININPLVVLQPGYEYQVSVRARTSGAGGTLSIKRGNNANSARSATGANIILSERTVSTSSVFSTFTANKFSVTSSMSLYMAFEVYGSTTGFRPDPIYMIFDDLVITRTCLTPTRPTVANSAVINCGSSVQLSASGTLNSWEQYKWYDPNGNVINGQTSATYTATESGTYQVSKVNTATGCTTESERVSIQVSLGLPNAPTVDNSTVSDCEISRIELKASGATNGQEYRWYTQENGGTAIAGAITDTHKPSQAGTYYVCIRNAAGCEGPRVAIKVEILDMEDALTDIEFLPLEVGKPAVLTLNSALRDNNQVANYVWEMSTNGGTFETVGINSHILNLPSVPAENVVFRCILTPNGEYCYTENSYIATTQSITPLPVELMFFKAQAQIKGVSLAWATASELENKGFEVQVSNNGRDFSVIGFVESKVGTTSLRQDYNFLDTKAVSGTRYYRLKQIDFDGTASYSPIRAVALNTTNAAVSAYPNPFDDAVVVTLNGSEARRVQVMLMDASGKVLQQRTEETSGNSITVDMRTVTAKGMYVLYVLDNDTKHTFKLMKR